MKHRIKYSAVLFFVFLFITPFLFAGTLDEKTVTITVAKKDNLINICKTWLENPHDWKRVSEFNQLKNPHLIYPGQHIIIPVKLLKGIPMEGVVTFIKGDVWTRPKGAEARAVVKKGDVVGQSAQIETGEKSAVEITFEDGSAFFLRPDTRISIRTARQRQPYFMIRRLFVPAGRTMMHIQKSTGGDSRFEIHTPSAVSAVRGTQFRVSVDNNKTTRTEVLDGVVVVAGTKKKVMLDPGQGTWVEKGKQPNNPQTLLPPPALEGLRPSYQSLPVDFSLAMPQKAVAARVILAKDPEMKNVVKEFVVQKGDTIPKIMLPDGNYYCQALSINPAGLEGLPLAPEGFKVRINPFPPFVQRPVNGEKFKTKQVEVEWLKVSDAVSYSFQVSRESDFKNLYKDIQGITGTRQSIDLEEYGIYYFRVFSIAGDDFKGLWSDAISFSFVEPPKAPEAKAPAVDEKTISLKWQDMGPDMTYLFQMAKDPLFKEVLLERTTDVSDICFDRPKKGGTYYVRVRAVDPDGYEGRFTPAQAFEIKAFPYVEAGVIATWVIGALIIIL
ncbi:FecR domain-containing protein [Desulfobacter curvatus]|uniref:FecR domain-containing protein n=1 Tax=Desulfobacter curvatus TaxID=2290 RepID=UPI000371869E|nr:FecR domain-containing protein [Desulfobacter curvatus]